MSTITIYYPGLLGPSVPLEELNSSEWPDYSQSCGLSELLSLGESRVIPNLDYEARLLDCLGISFSST